MYWMMVTLLGMAHYCFHKGRSKNTGEITDAEKPTPLGPEVPQFGEPDTPDPEPDSNSKQEPSLDNTSDPWERHVIYTRLIETAYRNRRDSVTDLETAMALSEQYVAEFPTLRQAVFDQLGEEPKLIAVFKMLAIMLEEHGAYDQAVRVCRSARDQGIKDGTKTGFEGRIDRILKKKDSGATA